MKKIKFSHLLMCVLPLLAISCDKDQNNTDPNPNENTTYWGDDIGKNTLDLTYLDATMAGKEVKFNANTDMSSAKMTLVGILPVAGDVTIDVAMAKNEDGSAYDLTLANSTDNIYTLSNDTKVTFGDMSVKAKSSSNDKGLLTMNITDVVATDNFLTKNAKGTGWWQIKGDASDPESLRLEWTINDIVLEAPDAIKDILEGLGVELEITNDDFQELVEEITPMLGMLLYDAIELIEFNANGQISAKYGEKDEDVINWQYVQGLNLVTQYNANDKFYVRLNVEEIINLATANNTPASYLSMNDGGNGGIDLTSLMPLLKAALSTDIELSTDGNNSEVAIYITADAIKHLVPILQMALSSIDLTDTIVDLILSIMGDELEDLEPEELEPIKQMLEQVAGLVPELIDTLIENTITFEAGLNLVAATAPTID